ncbi:hypothetical protein LXL04_004062 [Taraxacum kok-saghyz]
MYREGENAPAVPVQLHLLPPVLYPKERLCFDFLDEPTWCSPPVVKDQDAWVRLKSCSTPDTPSSSTSVYIDQRAHTSLLQLHCINKCESSSSTRPHKLQQVKGIVTPRFASSNLVGRRFRTARQPKKLIFSGTQLFHQCL